LRAAPIWRFFYFFLLALYCTIRIEWTSTVQDDYRRLVNELMRLLLAKSLFTFVTTPDVSCPNGAPHPAAGTNNAEERELRGTSQDRKTGRTSKTSRGACRRTVVKSVLESLRLYLSEFTLESVLAEVQRWSREGMSCFTKMLRQLKLKVPEKSILETIYGNLTG
jgi:transposase